MPSYPTKPPILNPPGYENICKCVGVAYRDKRSHIDALAACGMDGACAEAAHARLSATRKLAGPAPKKLFADEGLGVIVPETTFVKFTAAAFGRSVADFKRQLDLCLSFYTKRAAGQEPTPSENLATRSFMNATVPTRQDGSIWLFRNPMAAGDAFQGVENEWLGHRLGLDVSPHGEVRLTLGFAAGHVSNAHRPTFFDVPWSFLDLWDWQGKTKPLATTPSAMSGLEEIIAKPPEIGRVNRPIIRLRLNPR